MHDRLEACYGADHWARLFAQHGHTVRLMAPKFVAPYRMSGKRGKNDAADAQAICEAVQRPNMRFVPVKSGDEQARLCVIVFVKAWSSRERRPSIASAAVPPAGGPVRLLDRLRHAIRLRHYSYHTEQAYVDWSRRFILFHGKRHPRELGAKEVSTFLSHLASERHVSASTQSQARSALLFLFGQVLDVQLPWLAEQGRTGRAQPAGRDVVSASKRSLSIDSNWRSATVMTGSCH